MKVLVAGGAGFIGSHLCAALLQADHAVICLDNLSTGSPANIANLRRASRFTFRLGDVTTLDPASLDDDIAAVLHLASPASPTAYLAAPFHTIRANTEGTIRLLDVARAHSARFLFTSTSEIYGDPWEHPQTETYTGNVTTLGPRACYDESKRLGETITLEYWRQYGVDVRLVRIFNTYGPRMQPDDGRMVPTFIRQALAGDHLTVQGTGDQTRSLCYVSDTVEGIMRALFATEATAQVFNLGNPIELSVSDWAEKIIAICGTHAPIFRGLPRLANDPERRRPDIRKAQCVLGWSPQVSPDDGLRRTIRWFRMTQHRRLTPREPLYVRS